MSEIEVPGATPRSRRKKVIAGSPEHLDIVRGPLVQQIRQLELRNDCQKATELELREEILKHEARERELEARAERAEKALRQAQSDTSTYAGQAIAEANDLRSRLMDSELAYAKLRGYLEGKRDSEPPKMVPESREMFHAMLPDGSRGTDMGGWAGDGRQSKKWFHR